jgi:hypothetical protein
VRILRFAAAVLLAAAAPAAAQVDQQPAQPTQLLRLVRGGQLWTIPDAALQQFVDDGTFSDRRLRQLVKQSGWPEEALRVALAKPYAVDLVPLARFLYSPEGEAFLRQQTLAFRPLRGNQPDLRVEGLRSALLRSSASGTISVMALLRELPTAFVVDQQGAPSPRCSALPCPNPLQCSSVLSWLVFLPACLQAAAA